jgi:Ty3 transposon capsid-like protein/Zinc knuckle
MEYFLALKQSKMTVSEYTAEFHAYLVHMRPMAQPELITHYTRGLHDNIAEKVLTARPQTLADAEETAYYVDDVARRIRRSGHHPSRNFQVNVDFGPQPMELGTVNVRQNYPNNNQRNGERRGNRPPIPPRPSNRNNNPTVPRLSDEERARRLQSGACLKCGRQGHMARECRARPQGQQQNNQRPGVPNRSRQPWRTNNVEVDNREQPEQQSGNQPGRHRV